MLRLRILLVGLASAIFLACADDPDEAGLDEPTPNSSSASEAPSITSDESPSVTSPATSTPGASPSQPAPTASPDVGTWPVYDDPSGLFSVRYPPDWFEQRGDFYSVNPDTFVDAHSLPPGVTKVEFIYDLTDQLTACGAFTRDPESGEFTPAAEATPTELGGLPGWRQVKSGSEIGYGNISRVDGVSVINGSYCFAATAYHTEESPSPEHFDRILSFFEFGSDS